MSEQYRSKSYTALTGIIVLSSAIISSIIVPPTDLSRAGELSEKTYSYAPAVIESNDRRDEFTCHNRNPGQIQDSIFHREIGRAGQSSSQSALDPFGLSDPTAPPRFDEFHVCDPEVVGGQYPYGTAIYSWALLYSANDHDSAFGNRIGIAFSNSLDGPWIRSKTPLVDFDFSGTNAKAWGVGQPSVLPDPNPSAFILLYTRGTANSTGTVWQRVEVTGDLQNPFKLTEMRPVNAAGILRKDQQTPDVLHNAAYALDPNTNLVVAVRPLGPAPATFPTFVSDTVEIDTIPISDLFSGNGSWKEIRRFGEEQTGFQRNHDPGLVKDSRGYLPVGDLQILLTVSRDCGGKNCFPDELWTYSVTAFHLPRTLLQP